MSKEIISPGNIHPQTSVEILPELIRRFGDWIKPDVSSVKLIQNSASVFIETIFEKSMGDQLITRTNLSFMGGEEDQPLLLSKIPVSENAKIYLALDDYSLIIAEEKIFTPEAIEIILQNE